jgi:hypothetical protein
MWFELLNLIIGIAFGFFHHGREDYKGLIRNGVITGIILGIVFVLTWSFLLPGDLIISLGYLGVFGIFIDILLFVLIFLVGTFIGDRSERILKK